MKSQSQRIKHVIDLSKMAKLIKNQKEIASNIISVRGESISQPYLSQIINGGIKQIPNSFIDQFIDNYPFINRDYITEGKGMPFNEDGLKKYIEREHNDDKVHDFKETEDLIKYINEKYSYKINLNRHFPDLGTHLNPIENPQHLERVIELTDTLKRFGVVSTDHEFCEEIGLHTQYLVNYRSGRAKDVSKDVIFKILRAYPQISSDWLMLGIGPMFRKEKDLHGIFQMLRDDIKRLEKVIKDHVSS